MSEAKGDGSAEGRSKRNRERLKVMENPDGRRMSLPSARRLAVFPRQPSRAHRPAQRTRSWSGLASPTCAPPAGSLRPSACVTEQAPASALREEEVRAAWGCLRARAVDTINLVKCGQSQLPLAKAQSESSLIFLTM